MAKLSDIFGRKNEGGTDKVIPLPAMRLKGNGHSEHEVETLTEVGSRIGEENEALRNLLTDAGRKIGELDELKLAFDRLVMPFNSALRSLETEKSLTMSLSARLDEQRAAYDTLCNEFNPPRRGRRSSAPRPRSCAAISNCRARTAVRSTAPAPNCPRN